MSCDDTAIAVRDLSKTYRLFAGPAERIKQFLSMGLKQYHMEFTALQGASFDIRKGEVVSVIGRNGSGKSTLLQLICSILKPSTGSVSVNGKIAAILELGAGFSPDFTGRENVFFQGALQGLSKAKMEEKFDEIAAFADIGAFMEQPVRTYSSGMFVRLAFAVAVGIEPDILLIDEALAVGDFDFRNKCMNHLRRMNEAGVTLIMVSHDLETLKAFCDRSIYLKQGQVVYDGSIQRACELYFQDQMQKSSASQGAPAGQPASDLVEILGVTLSPEAAGPSGAGATYGSEIDVCVKYRVIADVDRLTIAFAIKDHRQISIVGTNTSIECSDVQSAKAGETRLCRFSFPNYLRSGEYTVSVGVVVERCGDSIYADWVEHACQLKSETGQRWSFVGPPTQVLHELLSR